MDMLDEIELDFETFTAGMAAEYVPNSASATTTPPLHLPDAPLNRAPASGGATTQLIATGTNGDDMFWARSAMTTYMASAATARFLAATVTTGWTAEPATIS